MHGLICKALDNRIHNIVNYINFFDTIFSYDGFQSIPQRCEIWSIFWFLSDKENFGQNALYFQEAK